MRVYEEYIQAFAVMEVGSRKIAMGKYGGLRIFMSHDHAARWIADREKWEIVTIYIMIEVQEGGARRAEKVESYKDSKGDEKPRR